MTITLLLAFISATQSYNLPPGLLSALCFTESSHHTDAIHVDDGRGNSLGECQLKLSTAKQMGFKGTERDLLLDPSLNIHFAAKYLRSRLDRYSGDLRKAVSAYNAGRYKTNNLPYVKKVLKAWEEQR